jgi:beta-lactamase superfamily II metal-dependent hydrolase
MAIHRAAALVMAITVLFAQCAEPVDEKPPGLGEVTVTDEGDGTFLIRWNTDVRTRGAVEYGLDSASYYFYAYAAGVRYQAEHTVRLFGLGTGQRYFFRVRSVSSSGETVFSKDSSLTVDTVTYQPKTLKLHLVDITDPCRNGYNPGDNFFLEFPNGRTMMYDSGDDDGSATIINYIRSLGYDTIDYGVLTHGHSDHYAGYRYGGIGEAFYFRYFLEPNTQNRSSDFDGTFQKMQVRNPSVQRVTLMRGASSSNQSVLAGIDANVQTIVVSAGADTLPIDGDNGPVDNSKTNNASLTMKFTFGQVSLLMTGDLEKEASRKWLENEPVTSPVVDILKVPHHARNDAVTGGMLLATDPIVAIASTQNCNCGGLMECDAAELVVGRRVDLFRADLADPNLNRLDPRSGVFKSNVVMTTDGSTIVVSHRRR